jgi:hypothetical protein
VITASAAALALAVVLLVVGLFTTVALLWASIGLSLVAGGLLLSGVRATRPRR